MSEGGASPPGPPAPPSAAVPAAPVARTARARRPEPVQEYFSIGEVCALTELKPHVLRYWETQFRVLSPAKNRSGNRVYARREVELVLLVKQLLYTEKYTLEGARQKLDAHRKGGDLRAIARHALARETALAVERDLHAILDVLEGRRAPENGAAARGGKDPSR
ncbi:MAG TPA: MerR family transcriptional regulator [Gemmatirosa sp.]|nr:MerR family transcriptional regulator [Gemmatirosa sp.]